MQSYVVVEMFLSGEPPKVRGIYKDKIDAEKIKNDYRFAYISEQNIIQSQHECSQKEVYILLELLKLNVPRIVGVFKNKQLSIDMANSCEYMTQIIEEQLN